VYNPKEDWQSHLKTKQDAPGKVWIEVPTSILKEFIETSFEALQPHHHTMRLGTLRVRLTPLISSKRLRADLDSLRGMPGSRADPYLDVSFRLVVQGVFLRPVKR
jgi:hypothetical protein